MSSINVKKRGKVYQYQFEVGKINGKRKRVSKSGFKTKKEAEEAGTKALNNFFNTGLTIKENNISFADYLDYWMENYCEINLKYNTIQTYKTIIEKYLKPYLGVYRLSALTSVKLHTFITEICSKYTLAKSYYRNILKVLKGCFREACDVYGFINYNPTITLRIPKIDEDREDIKHVYTQEEIDKILDRFKDDDTFTCAFLTSCYTGMRTGEVFALTWNDIDFEKQVINISHNVYDKPKDEKGRWYIGSTKTTTGKRTIHISETLLKILKNYKKKQNYLKKVYGKDYHYYHLEDVTNKHGKVIEHRIVKNEDNLITLKTINFIFTRFNGVFSGTDITKYPYKIIHDELGIKKCRFYDLRGSYATKTLHNGAEIRDIADNLGHKNIETTENYYISSSEESRKEANNLFDKHINSNVIEQIAAYKY